MSEKEKLLNFIYNPVTTSNRNIMGCDENWYNPYFAMKETFLTEEIEAMSEQEVCNLLKLACNISDGLY